MNATTKLFDLSGKLALVTGASRGIGHALSLALADAGADIVVAARSLPALEALKNAIIQKGRRCIAIACDVTSGEAVNALYAELGALNLSADILINNAGVEEVAPSTEVTEALWHKIVDTNLKGAFFVAQQFAKAAMAAAKPGSIINLASLTSAVGVPTAVPYTASKSGILGITRGLATEWAQQGIRVNAIGPGYFKTALTEVFYEDEQWCADMLQKIPLGRFGQLTDLAGVTIFLASDASAYVTGQVFYVDGGYLAAI